MYILILIEVNLREHSMLKNWEIDGISKGVSSKLLKNLNCQVFLLIFFFQGWCGKNHTGKYRVVFTGFYHQINPKSGKFWEIRF